MRNSLPVTVVTVLHIFVGYLVTTMTLFKVSSVTDNFRISVQYHKY